MMLGHIVSLVFFSYSMKNKKLLKFMKQVEYKMYKIT